MKKIIPLIIAGGKGSRLWPLSRADMPKQFAKFFDQGTLLEQTLNRVKSEIFDTPLILTASDYRFIVKSCLEGQMLKGHILLESEAKNTGPAVLSGMLVSNELYDGFDEDSLVLVMPSDHHIPDITSFKNMVKAGCEAASLGSLVTFGVLPTHPETGYGYIELEGSGDGCITNEINRVRSFKEKPNKTEAVSMLRNGNYQWNSGIYLFQAKTVLKIAKALKTSIYTDVFEAVQGKTRDLDFWRIDPVAWSKIEPVSFDHAIAENSDYITCVGFSSQWSDMGDWRAIKSLFEKTEDGNAMLGHVTEQNCKGSLIYNLDPSTHVAGVNLSNAIVVVTSDGVLVADKESAQDVQQALDKMKTDQVPQATESQRCFRPWGWFEVLTDQNEYKVKRLHVKDGGVLSLQSHKYRSEHWIIIQGVAEVSLGEATFNLSQGQSTFIPQGIKHRLSNKCGEEVIIIEVQTGSYFGEDDIVRYDDIYKRHG